MGNSTSKIKKELPYDSAVSHLGTYLGKIKTLTQKDTCTSTLTAALFAKIWKQPKCVLVDK